MFKRFSLLIKGAIFTISLMCVSFVSYAQKESVNPYNTLIPKPQKVEMFEGKEGALINKRYYIISPEWEVSSAMLLADYLNNLFGRENVWRVNTWSLDDYRRYTKGSLAVNKPKFVRKSDGATKIFINAFDILPNIDEKEKGKYYLSVLEDEITINAKDKEGVLNGIQTLLQLLPPQVYNSNNKEFINEYMIPAGKIEDYPQFQYRGYELDVSRTFRPAKDIYKVLRWMAHHKLNKFHWHLTDDQGWRVEIKSLPLLTEKGAWRGPDEVVPSSFGSGNKRYGGFYTQEQIEDIVRYSESLGIEIIPEIETPGHSLAVAASYPEILCNAPEDTSINNTGYSREIWCVAKESNYEFIEKIIKEVAELFPSKIINMGGDEVNHFNWKRCLDCQALMKKMGYTDESQLHSYFVTRVNEIAKKYNKKIAGWEEIMMADGIQDNSLIYVWHSKKFGPMAVQNRFDCVMQAAEYVYMDMKQSPIERGHNWCRVVPLDITYAYDPIALAAFAEKNEKEREKFYNILANRHVVGIQAGLWEELGNRPENFVEYQTFPRLCAVAETAWGTSKMLADSAANYNDFYNRLTQYHFQRMNNMGIRYRVPYPIVIAEEKAQTRSDVLRSGSPKKLYKITAKAPYENAVIKYAIVAPQTAADGIRGQKDTTTYKYVYTEPIITRDIANYRFATFVSDTLHSIGVAVSNVPLYNELKPAVKVETNMNASESSIKVLTEYKRGSYCRFNGRAKAGDYIIFTFDKPVQCSVIDIVTGRSNVDFYGITEGYAEYSLDGKNYMGRKDVEDSRMVLTPNAKVKSVRITITGESDGQNLILPPLLIY